MFISQPAISLAIKELEKYYGVKLFERVSRKLFLTDAGQVVYTYAAKIFSLLDGLNQELKHPVSGGWGGGLDRRWGELQPSREQGALPRARAQRRTRLLVFI